MTDISLLHDCFMPHSEPVFITSIGWLNISIFYITNYTEFLYIFMKSVIWYFDCTTIIPHTAGVT